MEAAKEAGEKKKKVNNWHTATLKKEENCTEARDSTALYLHRMNWSDHFDRNQWGNLCNFWHRLCHQIFQPHMSHICSVSPPRQ
jgi:hypothetical protein